MRKIVSVFILFLMVISFLSCDVSPRSLSDVSELFFQYEQQYLTVVKYLEALDYEAVTISKFDGLIFADSEYINIVDSSVLEAISVIHRSGCSYIQKKGEQISFELWSNFQDLGCGLVYSKNDIHRAEDCHVEEYVTYIKQLNQTDWYYYISDYNQWRANLQQSRTRGEHAGTVLLC